VPTISCHSGKSYQLARPLVFNSQHDGYTDGFADVSAIPHLFHPIQFNFIDIPTYRYFCPPPSSIAFRSPIRDWVCCPPGKVLIISWNVVNYGFSFVLFWFDFQLNFSSEFEYPALSFVLGIVAIVTSGCLPKNPNPPQLSIFPFSH